MDLQIRKLHIIQDLIRLDNDLLLDKMEALLREERMRMLETEIKPMTLVQYEQRVSDGIDYYRNDRVTTAKQLKKDIARWK